MPSFSLHKKCERCGVAIPDDYQNLLCLEDYKVVEKENKEAEERRRAQAAQEALKNPDSPTHPALAAHREPFVENGLLERSGESGSVEKVPERGSEGDGGVCSHISCGIKDPQYKENPEADDKDQVLANLAQFVYTHRDKDHPKGRKKGVLLYYPQRNMYTFIKNLCMKRAMAHPQYPKHIWKPRIVDVGCGSGVGSNILSQEADFVWGIDKNEFSIEFAQEAFTRVKNGQYYSSQLTFDVVDLLTDTRQFEQFDVVVAIEVIEHIFDAQGFLAALKRFAKKDKKGNHIDQYGTEFFISTPNRNNPKIRKDRPDNPFHVREWTSQEFKELLSGHFRSVELLNDRGEPVPDDAIDQIILARCSLPR